MSGIWMLKMAIPTSSLFPSWSIKWTKTLSERANMNQKEGNLLRESFGSIYQIYQKSLCIFTCGQNVFEHCGIIKVCERYIKEL